MPILHIKKHPLKYSTLAVIVLLISAAIFVPWKIIAEQKIIALLAQNGFAGSSVTLSHIGLKSAQMENLRLSKDATPLFDKLKVNFSARDLIKGHVDHLDFSGLNLQLEQNTTGDSNTACGRYALRANTTAASNSAFGASALFSTTTAGGNSAFGANALYANTTGTSNSAFGTDALFSTTT
ncbi:MAG: hypothetical protein EBX50_21735, partial [Chitinophagia bacterium]|nr:hypothetical protein [Chitinophagia bacterium]